MEGVWAIADASKSDTKFIISDHPVTIYNRYYGPKHPLCREYNDPDIRLHASHTIFPLSIDKILFLTNLSWARNPYQNGKKMRPNPNFFRSAYFGFQDIQTSRFLSENEVREINFILKSRAFRYITAAKKEWLYPERYVTKSNWHNYGKGYLFMPDPRSMTYSGGIIFGNNNGTSAAYDEYGRRPGQEGFRGFDDTKPKDDWEPFHQFQGQFARLFGPYRRGLSHHGPNIDDERDSDEYYQRLLDSEKLHMRRRWNKNTSNN